MSRLKVLLSAYACEPGGGSEPGIGWSVARELARHHDVWGLTRSNNAPTVETALASDPRDGLRFVYYDLPGWLRFWKRGQRGVQLYYYLWQLGARWAARRLNENVGFDVAQHVTLGKYWTPSLLTGLPVPLVWGPVGGGESAPKVFWPGFGLRGLVYEAARELARWVGERLPSTRRTARRAVVALATTAETAVRLRRLGARRVEVFSNAGTPSDEFEVLSRLPAPPSEPVRFLSSGRLLHWKGFHLSVEAFARAGLSGAEYWIAGDGPERSRLERLARRLGVAERVRFLGWLPRERALAVLADCHVLVYPSLHDSGGWVCLEAMAAGRPVICLDLGGPAVQVTEECGIKVPARSPRQVVSDVAAAMRVLATDPVLRARIGQAARRRVEEEFLWSRKVEHLASVLKEAARGSARPEEVAHT